MILVPSQPSLFEAGFSFGLSQVFTAQVNRNWRENGTQIITGQRKGAHMAKKFNMVLGLHITPDFSDAEAGRAPPPRVNHDTVDFGKLRAALKETFCYGPSVEILVGNDTVDQVTVQLRFGMFPGVPAAPTEDLMACHDFGQVMLGLVGTESNGIIDVRKAWQTKHVEPVRDRAYAPPPVLIPFVVVADDFEDAMIWQANTRPAIGLDPFDPLESTTEGQMAQHGHLSSEFQNSLHDIFGCPYKAYPVMLDRLAMDKAPAWAAPN